MTAEVGGAAHDLGSPNWAVSAAPASKASSAATAAPPPPLHRSTLSWHGNDAVCHHLCHGNGVLPMTSTLTAPASSSSDVCQLAGCLKGCHKRAAASFTPCYQQSPGCSRQVACAVHSDFRISFMERRRSWLRGLVPLACAMRAVTARSQEAGFCGGISHVIRRIAVATEFN